MCRATHSERYYDGGFVSYGDGKGRISRKVIVGFQTNGIVGTKDNIVAGQAKKKKEPEQEYILIPICITDPLISQVLARVPAALIGDGETTLTNDGPSVLTDFKEYMLRDYYYWLKNLMLLDNDAGTSKDLHKSKDPIVPVATTSAEQRLARKNELKARGTLLMALPDKHRLKFNIHKDDKSLMEAIEKRFGGNKETKKVQKTLLKQQYKNFTGSSSESLDQIHDRLQKLINQLEILGESLSQEDINLKFLRSLPTEWRTHILIWRNKTNLKDQSLDNLFNSLKIYEAKVKDVDDSEEIDLKWQMAMLTIRAKRFLQRKGRNLGASGTTSIGFDMSKEDEETTNYALMAFTSLSSLSSDNKAASYSKACSKAYATLQSHYDKLTNDLRKSQFDVLSYKIGLESIEARILVYQQNEHVFEKDIKLLKLDVMLRDNALVELRKKFEKAEQDRDKNIYAPKPDLVFHDAPTANETIPTVLNVEPSTTKPNKDLSQSNRPSAPIIEDWVSDSEDESEGEHMHIQIAPSFVQPSEHVKTPRTSVKPVEHPILFDNLRKSIPKSRGHRHSWNRKACFVCKSLTHLIKDCDYYEKKMVQKSVRNHAMRENPQHSSRMTHIPPNRHVVPTAILTRSRLVPLNADRLVSTVVPKSNVKHHMPANQVANKPHSLIRRTINHNQSPKNSNFHQKVTTIKTNQVNAVEGVKGNWGNPQHALKDKGVIDNGCSRHMTGNISYLFDFEEINGGYVAFGGNPKGGKITGKGKIRTGKLDFNDVYFVEELKFNLFSVSQLCDKKNSVLFTDTKCVVLFSDFKLPDDNHVLLRVLRENNIYNVDLKNIVSSGDLTCLFAKATLDESNLWHRRLGHIKFKTMNKLVKGNLVRGLPLKVFENNHTCVACKKGKQHRASCKSKPVSSISQPLQRSDNGTKFKNQDLNQFCGIKGIKREFSLARTPQQNGIAERKNKTLIEAAKTMLVDSLLPIPFWTEAVNTACYVQNKVLVTKPHNKTPCELLLGRTPSIGFMRPFGCHVTILNTLDPLGKFDGKADEGFLVGYSVSNKAFRVFNSRTRIIQETLHIKILENQPNVAGSGPTWLFDIDTLTKSMNYQPVVARNQPNSSVGIQEHFDACKEGEEPESEVHASPSSSAKTKKHDDKTKREAKGKSHVKLSTGVRNLSEEFEDFFDNSTNGVNAANTPITADGPITGPSNNVCKVTTVGVNLNTAGYYLSNSQNIIDDKGYCNSGCSRHMIGNISYLSDYEPYDGGYVSFGQGGGKITGKCVIKTSKVEFENVYFVKDLKYNLFSVSQICDNKNSVLFTDSECIVLRKDFKLKDNTNVFLRTPRQHNMYSTDLNNIVSHKDLTCLVTKASTDESMLWHRRLRHLNFKTMNKLVRHNLVKGLPSKCFENDHTCVACLKGKQHKAFCKTKSVHSVSMPLHTLHMDLFGPTSVSSLNHKWYCLVVTDDFSRCDNGGEFRNKEMTDFCSSKGIKREFSNARTPQQNRVAKRRNKTLIEAARTMLADAKLPVTFWAEAVNTACYVQNRVLSSSEENVSVENFKIYSNPLPEFDEEIFSSEFNPLYNEVLEDLDSIPPRNENDHFNAESNLIESLLNNDTVITSPKIDFLLEEFAGELALINPIPPEIAETNFDQKENIHLIKKLLYDNSSPRPPKGINSKNDFEKENSCSTTIHTYISLIEYESFDDESDSASEIFNDDLAHIISPSEYEYVYADDESNSGDLTTDVVEDILGDTTRKHQMSHRGFKALKISHNFFNKSPMMIYGGDMPILDVLWPPMVTLGRLLPHARGLEFKPRRRGFPSGAKKEWGLSPKEKVRFLHTAQLDVTLAKMGYEKPSTKLTFYKAFLSAKWKFLIHTIIQYMGAKRTSWNEFSSSMASAVICLTTVESTLPLSPNQSHIAQPSSHYHNNLLNLRISLTLPWLSLINCWRRATLTQKVGTLEQDKIAQAIKITKIKQRVRRLEKKKKLKASGFKRLRKETEEAEPAEVEEVIELVNVAKLTTEVVTTTAATTNTAAPVLKASAPRRRRGVIIQDPEEAATASVNVQSLDKAYGRELEAELNANINWNDVIEQVKRKERKDNTIMRYQSLKRKPVTEAHARKNMMEIEEEESKKSKRKSKSSQQKAAKRQRINEEVEELKTHLQIVPNDEDDVYTEATPLALKCMRTRSSSNLVGESSPNPTTSNPKRHNRRPSKQPFIFEESPVDTMADQRTMVELLRAPTEDRYKNLLHACPHHGFTELNQLDTFYNALNPDDQDSLNSATGGNLLERGTQDVLTIIENKSKVCNSQNKSIVSQVKSNYDNSSSSFEIAKLTHAINQQTSAVTTVMTAILKQFQATPPPAFVKVVEEICVTCGSAHPYYYGLVLDGPSVPMPTPFINLEEDECVEDTLTDLDLAEYTIKVPHSLFQKAKPPSQRNYVVHQRDPRHPNIHYPSRMHKQKHQDKDEIQIHKFWQMFKQLHINITLADALILILKYLKMLKALLCNKEKLLELANTLVNENCSAVILKKLPEKLGDPGKFLIPCGFSELKEEMILHDADERLTLNMRHETSSYSNQPQKESINMINIYDDSYEDYLEDLFATNHLSGNPPFSSHTNLTSPEVINPLSGSTTSSSPDHLLEEFADELALITFPLGNDDLPFDIKSDLREIEYLLNHDPTKEMDSILEDLIDECNLANPNNNLFDTIPEMFTDEHTLDYSSPPLYDDFDDNLFELESDNDDAYDDPFDSKEEKIKESKLLICELDLPRSSDFLSSPEYDSFLFEDFFGVDALPSINNEDKVFNLGILIHEILYEVTIQVTLDKNVKQISISNASLIFEDFHPPLYELPFHKKVPGFKTLLLFSFKNKEKVFKHGILTSKGVHTSLFLELSHRGLKAF
nr:hypothetical protein [Tanacetum cinerariifolium]